MEHMLNYTSERQGGRANRTSPCRRTAAGRWPLADFPPPGHGRS